MAKESDDGKDGANEGSDSALTASVDADGLINQA
jgi:hypothetical protein